jgi:hypothetical protein
MHANGHTTVWGTHIGLGRAADGTGWYQQLKTWWAAHKAARQQATLNALHRCWDAKREAVRPLRADAVSDMATSIHVLSITTALCDLSV